MVAAIGVCGFSFDLSWPSSHRSRSVSRLRPARSATCRPGTAIRQPPRNPATTARRSSNRQSCDHFPRHLPLPSSSLSSSPPGLTRWSMLMCSEGAIGGQSPKPPPRMDCRVKPGNDDVRDRSRDACASELCLPPRAKNSPGQQKREAKRRKAHANHLPRIASGRPDSHPRLSSRPCFRDATHALTALLSQSSDITSRSVYTGLMPEAAPARIASPRGSTALAPHFGRIRMHSEDLSTEPLGDDCQPTEKSPYSRQIPFVIQDDAKRGVCNPYSRLCRNARSIRLTCGCRPAPSARPGMTRWCVSEKASANVFAILMCAHQRAVLFNRAMQGRPR